VPVSLTADESIAACREHNVALKAPTVFLRATAAEVVLDLSAADVADATRRYRVRFAAPLDRGNCGADAVEVTLDVGEEHLAVCVALLPYEDADARIDQKLLGLILYKPLGVVDEQWVKVQPDVDALGTKYVNLSNSLISCARGPQRINVSHLVFQCTPQVEVRKQYSCAYAPGTKWFVHKAAIKMALFRNGELRHKAFADAIDVRARLKNGIAPRCGASAHHCSRRVS
jgi:hypothetical protein